MAWAIASVCQSLWLALTNWYNTMFNRSRRNLARWFTLSMGSILVIFAGVLYLREARDRLRTFDQTLYNTSRIMAAGVEDYIYNGEQRTDLENVPILGSDALPLASDLSFARWYTPEKRLLQFVGPIPPLQLTTPSGFQTVTLADPSTATLALDDPTTLTTPRLRQLTLPVYQQGRLLGYLQVAASLAPVETPLNQLQMFLTLGVPVTLGTIALAGWLLGGKAMQPIRQSYEQLQQFTADASHELRAPLAAILNQAQVGLMEPIDPKEQTKRLQTIVTVAESMSLLVSQLLFLARHDGQLSPEVLKTVDVVALVQPLVDDYSHLPSSSVWLQAEPDLLRQAIVNLLSNALRYTPAGGTVALRVVQQPRWVVIEVKDSGIGIAPEDVPHLFDRFYRADPVRSRQTGGFGLGLAIARQVVDAHAGHITVTSTVGQGSTFAIHLPFS